MGFNEKNLMKKKENFSIMDSEKEGAWRKIRAELRDNLGLGW